MKKIIGKNILYFTKWKTYTICTKFIRRLVERRKKKKEYTDWKDLIRKSHHQTSESVKPIFHHHAITKYISERFIKSMLSVGLVSIKLHLEIRAKTSHQTWQISHLALFWWIFWDSAKNKSEPKKNILIFFVHCNAFSANQMLPIWFSPQKTERIKSVRPIGFNIICFFFLGYEHQK